MVILFGLPLLFDLRPDADTTITLSESLLYSKVLVVLKTSLGLLMRQKSAHRDVFNTCIISHLIQGRCLSMTSLGPGCALEAILFVCVEDHMIEAPQAQHPVIKALTLIRHSRSTELVDICTNRFRDIDAFSSEIACISHPSLTPESNSDSDGVRVIIGVKVHVQV